LATEWQNRQLMTPEMDPIKDRPPTGTDTETGAADPASLVATLRKLIIDGRYGAGERLAEIPVAAALGVSRTPVRLAFRTLEQEGLLEKTGKRGYTVRAFSEADVLCALEVRGALEGLAARRLAEQAPPPAVLAELDGALAEGAAVLGKGHLTADDIAHWSRLNERFHRAIVQAGGGRVIADAIARNDHLPFASAGSLVIDRDALEREYLKLQLAQMQHQLIVDALRRRESARVEMLMREHAYIALRYGRLFGLEVQVGAGGTAEKGHKGAPGLA